MIKILTAFFVSMNLVSCYSINPKNAQSSMIILSAFLEKDEPFINEFIDPQFDSISIRQGDKKISYSEKSGNYFYFTNLSPGQYEIGEMIHLIQKGNGGNSFANSKSLASIEPPLTQNDKSSTYINLEPGSVAFMGEITVFVDLHIKGSMEIKATLNKDITSEKRAIDYFIKNYPRSGWIEPLKERKLSLNAITVEK
jgi:hypothetical protein